jgi:flagellar hook-basal body complex protein FliE
MAANLFAAGSYAATQNLLSGTVAGSATNGTTSDFASLVREHVDAAKSVDQQVKSSIEGKSDLLSVVTAVTESESAIETLVAVRDKVIAAYEEVMRMTV